MDKGEARARLIALAENTPKGAQRDALVMGANALIEDIANQWLEEHDKQTRAEVWADIEKIISNMSNPIQTMEIIIEQLKEQKNE